MKWRNFIKIISFSLLGLILNSCSPPDQKIYSISSVGRAGDDLSWKAKNLDETDWNQAKDLEEHPIFWIRSTTEFPITDVPYKNMGIKIGATGAYEAYWDGQFIGSNGELQTATKKEVPGKYQFYLPLPDSLAQPGTHVLALRMTKASPTPGLHVYYMIDDYFELTRSPLQVSKYMFMLAGAFLLTAVYFFFVFLSNKKDVSILIFSFICLIFLALLLMEYLKFYYQYTYPFQRTRLEIIGYCHLLLTFLIPLFFMIQFSFPWKKLVLALLGITVIILEYNYHYSFDWIAKMHNLLMWICSFGIIVYASFKKTKGALVVLLGFILSMMVVFFMPYFYFYFHFISPFDVSLFIGFILIIISMLYVMSERKKEERLAYEASLVVSERLKNELLKKNIKPHFIMNTLTSLIDWVEESPKEGVKFIHALADEFDVLNDIADYKLVPIGQEIKLCTSLLRVMKYRKEIIYEWNDFHIDPNEIIPPAIIHTAVENGLTHSLPGENGKIIFNLYFEKTASQKTYTLQTQAKIRNPQPMKIHAAEDGTGFKYIKSRLQESYPNQWELDSYPIDGGWEIKIKIKGQ